MTPETRVVVGKKKGWLWCYRSGHSRSQTGACVEIGDCVKGGRRKDMVMIGFGGNYYNLSLEDFDTPQTGWTVKYHKPKLAKGQDG